MLTELTSSIGSRPLGLARVMIGLAALIRAFVAWRGLTRLTEPDTLAVPFFDWMPEPTTPLVISIIGVWVVAGVLFVFGWKVVLTGPALLASIVATLAFDQQAYSNHLYLMAWLVLLLTIADAGSGLNLHRSDRMVVRWPALLLMVQMSIVYGFSAITKMNESFLSGRVLAGSLDGGLIPFPDALRTPSFLMTVAAVAIFAELFVAVFMWSSRFRPAAFVFGFGLHLSIVLLMTDTIELTVFGLEMLALYPLFLTREKLVLVWDDECDSCGAWVRRFEALDVLKTVVPLGASDERNPIPVADVQRSLHLTHQGQTTRGFRAITRTLEHLVPTLWVAPVLRLWGVRRLGEKWYRWQAARRSCRVGSMGLTQDSTAG